MKRTSLCLGRLLRASFFHKLASSTPTKPIAMAWCLAALAAYPLATLGQELSTAPPFDPNNAPVMQPPTVLTPVVAPQLPSGAAVGRIKGAFGVSPTGDTQYSIPIYAPEGIAGMQPSLALTYSSSGGDGLYGVGWSVSSQPAITRCAKTVGQDGLAANVFLTTSDLYCLNGSKLRLFSGTYGADGAQYQTEIADFSLVISHGTAGQGPAWFEVHGKDGLIYQYGNTAHSALIATGTTSVIQWALNRITDRFGNHMDYDYTNDATYQTLRLATITYTTPGTTNSNVQQTPNYQIQFTYVSRTSPVPGGFISGAQFMEPYLAQTITVAALSGSTYVAALTYNLQYTTGGATGRSLLNTITECSPTQCFSPTTVNYQSGTAGWGSAITTTALSLSLDNAYVGDLNGDGIDDIVYVDKATSSIYYLLGTTSGTYQGPYNAQIVGAVFAAMDYNADGKMDLLSKNSSGNVRVNFFSSPGSAFTYTDTLTPAPPSTTTGYVMVGDVDGDGREDLIYAVSSGSSWTSPDYIYYRLNTGSGFGTQQTLATIGSTSCTAACQKLLQWPFGEATTFNSRVRKADFNGDGRIDLLANITQCNLGTGQCTAPTFKWFLFVSDASNNTYDRLDVVSYDAALLTGIPPLVGDFNGDGCSDIAYVASSGAQVVQYGTCLRTGAQNALSAAVATGVGNLHYPMAIDWDGDGRDDIVDTDGSTWGYAHSTGTGFDPWTSTGIPYSNADTALYAALVADVYGDGHYGIIYPAASTYKITALPHKGQGITADLAISFTDGFGVDYGPSYKQLTSSSVYTKGTGAAYPEQDIEQPMSVVASYTASDGIGGTYTVTQLYTQARMNVNRQEFEGFGSVRTVDSRNNLYGYTDFAQLSPQTGFVTEQTMKQPDNATIVSDVTNTITTQTLDSTNKRYFPYVSQSVSSAYEVGGTINGTLTTQKTTVPSFTGPNGFTYGNPSKIVTTTVDKDPNSPWPGAIFTDTINITPYEVGGATSTGWCIHWPGTIAETRTQPGGASLTHTTTYTVNSSSECELDTKAVENTNTTGQKVVTAYAYTDGCGNVTSATVTGQTPSGSSWVNMAARPTTFAYGSHCIYPETVTNALSQQTLLSYRYDLGLPSSSEDPNLLITSWQYNDIGQRILDQRPDGTQTTHVYTPCSSNCGFSVPATYVVQNQERDSTSNHNVFQSRGAYYDQFDRQTITTAQTPTSVTLSTTTFDSLGRVHQKSSPYLLNAPTIYYTTYASDLVNRVSTMARPISANNSNPETTYYTYQGRTSTVQDPKGYTTKKQTDVIGELEYVTDADGVSKTQYGYDPYSNLTLIKDPAGNSTTRTFDALGYQLTASSDPDRGAWTFQYDSLGELVSLRDAKTSAPSWTQQISYDVLGRTLQRVENEGTTTWTWGTSQSNHEIGQLTGLSGLSDTETYTFDSAGRPNTRSMLWNGLTYTVSYSYNTIGKLNTLTYPIATGQANAFAVLYAYTNGYLSSLQNYTGGVGGTTFWELTPSVTNMDAFGHVTDETLGTTSAVRIQSGFDGVTGWIGTRTVGNGGSLNNLSNFSYGWDLNGNLSQREDVKQSLTEAITYDNLNRFQNSTVNGTQLQAFVFDSTGNITTRTSYGTTYPYTYDTTHKHAVASFPGHTYTYDANGNMATKDGATIMWSTYNLPVAINGANGMSSSFYYGPDRQRKEQVATYNAQGDSGTETTTYVFGLYEHETTPAQTHDKYFVQVPGGTQIIYDIQSVSGTQVTYITADHLGSANLLINSAGNVLIGESFEAYGRRRLTNWSGDLSSTDSSYTTIASTTRRGFTDGFHEFLDNLTLIHMNGRVYDPGSGRFISPDPIVTQVGNSQSINPYSYVQNRPLTLTDPTGLAACLCKRIDGLPAPGKLKFDPGSLLGPPIGGLEGISGFDANMSDISSTGDPVSMGAYMDEATATNAMANGYSVSSTGQIGLNPSADTPTGLAATAALAAYDNGKTTVTGYDATAIELGGANAVAFTGSNNPGANNILAFRGTATAADVLTDLINAAGFPAPAYRASVAIAEAFQEAVTGSSLLTGHSLGGGEAALASYVTGIPAITFNAAGVDPKVYGYSGGTVSQITNYFVVGEPVSDTEELGAGSPALGTQVPLAPAGWPGISNRANHSMVSVVAALQQAGIAVQPPIPCNPRCGN